MVRNFVLRGEIRFLPTNISVISLHSLSYLNISNHIQCHKCVISTDTFILVMLQILPIRPHTSSAKQHKTLVLISSDNRGLKYFSVLLLLVQ